MSHPHNTFYFFARREDGAGFEHISVRGDVKLDHLIGETIASALCDDVSGLDLVRFHRSGEELVVQKRLSDIKATLTIYR